MHRQSYLAQDDAVPYDHERFIAQDRILTTAENEVEISDLKVSISAQVQNKFVHANGRVDAAGVTFETSDQGRTATLSIAVFCTDGRERLIGERWETMDLRLTEPQYLRAVEDGFRYTVAVPVDGGPRFCKVVVYDYPSDRIGSAITRLR
jgi:hypothetical protein